MAIEVVRLMRKPRSMCRRSLRMLFCLSPYAAFQSNSIWCRGDASVCQQFKTITCHGTGVWKLSFEVGRDQSYLMYYLMRGSL